MSELWLYIGLGLLVLGLLLTVAEAFVPSAGLLAIFAAISAAAGVACLFKVDWRWGVAGLGSVVVLGPVVFFMGLQILPSTPWGRKLIGAPPGESGEDREPPRPDPMLALIDAEGEAATDLRPGGFVKLEGKRLPAMSEVAFVPAGTRVRVIGVDSMQVRVRPV